jgi:flavin reductase (DIM6/NTAB) family NADH-FMN oxidoreductase RutF
MTTETEFDEVFDLMQTGVYVITADDGTKMGGCTAVWVSRCSFEPPMVAVFIAPKRFTHDIIKRAKHFCVNIVGERHLQTAKDFGLRTSANVDKFVGVQISKGLTGAPILKDVCAYLECELVQEFEIGDHTCFVGKVMAAEKFSLEKPLIYRHEDYYPRERQAEHEG